MLRRFRKGPKMLKKANLSGFSAVNPNPGLVPKLPSASPFVGTENFVGMHLCHHLVVYILKQKKCFKIC